MYRPDEDTVSVLESTPQPDVGAPCPLIVADEFTVQVAYFARDPDPNWDGTYVTLVGSESSGLVAQARFTRPRGHRSGPPNDEAFSGHPLAARGLRPYAIQEVHQSSWIRSMERMNSVHPSHDPEAYDSLRHFIFAFHDSVLECVAEDFEVKLHRASLKDVAAMMLDGL